MPKYMKRIQPTFEATQWFKHGDHPEVIESRFDDTCGWLKESLSNHFITPGDYIIKHDNGEYSVQTQKEFESEFIKVGSIEVNFQKATPMRPRTIDLC